MQASTAVAGEPAAEKSPSRRQIIDADVHEMPTSVKDLLPYLAPQWHKFIASGWSTPYFFSYAYPREDGFARADAIPETGGPAGSDPELLREQLLEGHGVDVAMLTGLFYPSDSKVQFEFATALASAYNDWIVEKWLAFDDRLRGSVCINVNDPEGAAREIDRMASHPGYVQVMLPPLREGYGQQRYDPIFAAAVRNDLLVGMHPSSNAPTALGYPPYLVEWRICSAPQHHMSQVVSLIFSGVFERHPEVRMVLIEGGWTWLPHLLGRMDENYRSLRAEIPWLRRMPSRYVFDHIRFTTQPMPDMTADQLLAFIELIGSDEMLLFSSDYPHFDADNPFRAFPRVPADLMHKIMYENAKSWYRL
jgi:predicted TIM-barrel fold metal-dependent hydrolase